MTEIAEAAGVSRVTVWRWNTQPEFNGFREWLAASSERVFTGALAHVHSSMLRGALRPDATPAHRLYLERFDKNFQAKADESTRGAQITINLAQALVNVAGEQGMSLLRRVAEMRNGPKIEEPK